MAKYNDRFVKLLTIYILYVQPQADSTHFAESVITTITINRRPKLENKLGECAGALPGFHKGAYLFQGCKLY